MASPLGNNHEDDRCKYIASDIDMDLPAYSAHPETARPLENIPLPPGIVDNVNVTPARIVRKRDNIVSEYGSDKGKLDTSPQITPAYEQAKHDNLFLRGSIRRFTCSNGLIYEDAPYHGAKDNPVKSKAPTDPKFGLENSVPIKVFGKQRISYDPFNKEICIFSRTRDNIYHGHVREWVKLPQEAKNTLIKEFKFKISGSKPTNKGQ